jgi:peptidylprolyl isomerase
MKGIHRWLPAILAAAVALAPAIGQEQKPAPEQKTEKSETKMHTNPSGLQWTDIKEGTGETPKTGQIVVVDYTGWLFENGQKGKKFDSSVDRGQPIEFPIGQGRVIKGWDEGVGSMKVGGKRTLIIPPDIAYGARGRAPVIPPNATLIFDVELIAIK